MNISKNQEAQIAYLAILVEYNNVTNPLSFDHNPSDLSHSDEILVNLITKKKLQLESSQQLRLHDEFFATGPIEALLKNDSITEIIINDWRSIYFEKDGQLCKYDDHFFSESSYFNCCKRICEKAQIQLSLNNPFGNGKIDNFRVHAISQPVSDKRIALTLRRIRSSNWKLQELRENSLLNDVQFSFLKDAIAEKKSFLICGSTGTGKTTLLSACLAECHDTERIVLIEDTPELQIPNENSLKLITRPNVFEDLNEITGSRLVIESLRMRPDRLIIGEIRGNEAKDFILAVSTGHCGSIASIHAKDAKGALRRLQLLAQMGAPQWTPKMIQNFIFDSIDFVVCIARASDGSRSVQEISQLTSLEENGFTLQSINELSPINSERSKVDLPSYFDWRKPNF